MPNKNLNKLESKTLRSKTLYERAKKVIPGGVQANAKYQPPYPLFMKNAKGSKVTDVDGNEYIDYVMAYGPLILGHSHPEVVKAIESYMHNYGTYIFGTPIEEELKFVEKICSLVPCAQMVRFTNSGNEATYLATRLARAYTKRRKMGRFEGHYHGWNDVAAISNNPPLDMVGDFEKPNSVPQSIGLPFGTEEDTIVLQFNDIDILHKQIKQHKDDLAGIILEPISKAYLPTEHEFMKTLRELTEKYGIVLIFDEVITGFRLGLAGAQGYYKVTPDLVTLGKILGGGLPIAAVAGKEEIMELISPVRALETGKLGVFHSGTYNGYPLGIVAGLKTIEMLETTDAYQRANSVGEALRKGLNEIVMERHIEARCFGLVSIFHLLFTKDEIKRHRDVMKSDWNKLLAFDNGMWANGVWLIPRHQCYASAAHSKNDVDKTLEAADEIIKGLK